MDYDVLKGLMSSSQGPAVIAYLQTCIDQLRDEPVDPSLPAAEYKAVSIGQKKAINRLQHMLAPFLSFRHEEVQRKLKEDNLYYSHTPKRKDGVV